MSESKSSSGCFSAIVFIGVLLLGLTALGPAANREGDRQFLYIGSEPHQHQSGSGRWGTKTVYPLEDPFHGVRFPPGTTLELLGSAEGTFTVTSSNGSPFTFDNKFLGPEGRSFKSVDYEVMNSPWDTEQDRPICVSDSVNSMHSYFQWFASNDLHYLMIAIVASILIALASVGKRNRLWTLLVVAALVVVAIQVNSPDDACALRPHLESYRASSGHILPVPDYRIVAPYGDRRGYLQALNARTFPSLCLLVIHAILAVSIFPALRGVHYLFVKHPVEPFLETNGLEDSIPLDDVHEVLSRPAGYPRQEFIEDNQARRIEAQTRRLEAEAKLAEVLLERERSRAKWKRTKDE